MPSSIGVALIGAGNIAQSIHLPLLQKMPEVRLEAIVDRQVSKARLVADKHKVPLATKSLDDVLRMPSVDAVIVTTSTDAHAEIALAAIHAGNKQRAAKVLENAPYLRIHGSKPRPIEQAIDYWRSVCAGIEPDYQS